MRPVTIGHFQRVQESQDVFQVNYQQGPGSLDGCSFTSLALRPPLFYFMNYWGLPGTFSKWNNSQALGFIYDFCFTAGKLGERRVNNSCQVSKPRTECSAEHHQGSLRTQAQFPGPRCWLLSTWFAREEARHPPAEDLFHLQKKGLLSLYGKLRSLRFLF